MVRVFNPIYDTVFKYLVEDERVAKILLSSILDKKIESVTMKSNDHVITTPDDLKLLRIDFAATIINDDGTKEIATIELQKAFEEEEVMRFRKYMGLQISSENNTIKVVKTKRNKDKYEVLKPLPIYCIYILGHKLGDGYDKAVIKTKIALIDQNGDVLANTGKSDFINAMLINIAIVQIPLLPLKPKLHVEKMLSIFDQRFMDQNQKIYIELNDNAAYGEEYDVLISRLLKGTVNEKLRGDLDFEEEMLRQMKRDRIDLEDAQLELKEIREELTVSKNQLAESQIQLAESQNQLAESQNQLAERETQLAERETQLAERETQLAEFQNQLSVSIKLLSAAGISPEQIASNLNIPIDQIQELLQ